MAAKNETGTNNVKPEYNNATTGLNMDQTLSQVTKGKLTYAHNATVENFDANSVTYQNEPGTEFCVTFPDGFALIGAHFIQERSKQLFFLTNPLSGVSEIGYMDNNDCIYHTLISSSCLGWDVNKPIQKIVHKITNCSTEIYWSDNAARRYLNIDNVPYKLAPEATLCDPSYVPELDCNNLTLQPNFSIPQLNVIDVITGGGGLTAGTVQFAIQYADVSGNPYTSYYSITNPTPISNPQLTTPNFNYEVGKSVVVEISNLDGTGQFQYFNLAVIKTINNIPSVELIGTYFIDVTTKQITYTGQNKTLIQLTINDIFEKYPYYDLAEDVTAVQDILIWGGLTTIDRINYQSIFSQITTHWQTYKIPSDETYANELNATSLRGYLRDEVYALEGVFLLRNGRQTDSFHIPGRSKNQNELYPDVPSTDPDFIGQGTSAPYWKIYNTGSVIGPATGPTIGSATPYQYGEFAYWESAETYPCNVDVWGELAGQPIRHHKFPDVLISPVYESAPYTVGPGFTPVMQKDAIFPIGIRIDVQQVATLIATSNLTQAQKDEIVGFKILRGDRGTNKSIVGKGILRNVNSYVKEEQTYYFSNYPYNDLGDDPLINSNNNAYLQLASPWLLTTRELDGNGNPGKYEFTDPNTNKRRTKTLPPVGETIEFCSNTRPITLSGKALIGPGNYDVWFGTSCPGSKGGRVIWSDPFTDDNTALKQNSPWLNNYSCLIPFGNCDSTYGRVEVDGLMAGSCNNNWYDICKCDIDTDLINSIEQPIGVVLPISEGGRRSMLKCAEEQPLTVLKDTPNAAYRQVFNSPETSFGQPFLGNVLKLENVMFGAGKAHFVEVKKNAKYKLLSKEAQEDALKSSNKIGSITNPFNATAMFTAYQAYLTIYVNGITRKNYAYSANSIASYDYSADVPNGQSIKQRTIDLTQYLIPGVQSVGETNGINVNNYQRESSVYIRTDLTKPPLPYPKDVPALLGSGIEDNSRIGIGETEACATPGAEQNISVVSYYASMKNIYEGQWGQMYSYETIDTGFQRMFNQTSDIVTVFGGDTFISRFAFKTKLPFFIDNRVGAPDDSDIFYDEIGNIGYPKYWHSARSILENYTLTTGQVLTNFISYKAHNFDCPNDPASIPPPTGDNAVYGSYRTYYDGYFYLFAYGIPNFYCESSYNVDLRQAFNNKEGDFWPHVSTGIPDDWEQESFVSIANDNTYTYNVTYSKQNKENTFSHLPLDWDKECYTNYPFRAIYSDIQENNADARINNWLIYKPISMFDFPQSYGKLTSLDGIQNRAVLVRFENKSLLYNNLLTLDTSNPQAAYLGNPRLFEGAPPIDFAETDLGYVGSQHKFLLKIPEGQITIDAKRGQVFLISGTQAIELSGFGSGMNRFFTNNLSFEILRYFPDVDVDNNYTGVGLHGVYDSNYNRVIITKLDYIPLYTNIKYDKDSKEYYIEEIINEVSFKTTVYLTDTEYFCNKSWTVSYNMNTRSWISFHSYIPNWYIGENNFFYSGLNSCCSDLEGDFTALVGEVTKAPSTTTTTTTSIPITTTTTTIAPNDCELVGQVVYTLCDLVGTAVITVDPTTTTTLCQRPSDMERFILFNGYQFEASPEVDTTSTWVEACEGMAIVGPALPNVTMLYITANGYSLDVNQTLYLDDTAIDCTLVPDGWYYTQEGMDGMFVYHVVGGVIVAIESCNCGTTTTTTTLGPDIAECCGILFSTEDSIFYNSDDNVMINLDVPGFGSSYGIMMTPDYLWSIKNDEMLQWDITLSPFTATYNKAIEFPIGFTTESGGVALDNDNVILINSTPTPQEVVQMDITGLEGLSTTIFFLQANREAQGNMLLTTANKLLVINYDTSTNDYYISQYDYLTGAIELDLNIGDVNATSIYECECTIFVKTDDGDLYSIDRESPYALIDLGSTTFDALFATQPRTCVPVSITDNANLTTTTTTTTL